MRPLFAPNPLAVPVALLVLLASPLLAEDWPGWRGGRCNGISTDTAVPTRWTHEENVVWKVPVPGTGHASPIVCKGHVYLCSSDLLTGERLLLCFDRSNGNMLWTATLVQGEIERMHPKNTPASSTPATDGEFVYSTFAVDGQYMVFATDLEGRVVWKRSLGEFVSRHGFHSCPVMHGDSLLIAGLQDSGSSFVARLRAKDGSMVWKTPTNTEIRSFSPPHVSGVGGDKQIVVSGASCTTAFGFEDGQQIWRLEGPAEKTVSSIVEEDGRLFVPGGRESKLLAIDRGSADEAAVSWTSSIGVPYVPSPICRDGKLHLVSDKGLYARVDCATGKTQGRLRLGAPVSASPVLVGNLLYVADERGGTHLIDLDQKKPSVVATNHLQEPIYASFAVSDNELFVRTESSLFCLREEPVNER